MKAHLKTFVPGPPTLRDRQREMPSLHTDTPSRVIRGGSVGYCVHHRNLSRNHGGDPAQEPHSRPETTPLPTGVPRCRIQGRNHDCLLHSLIGLLWHCMFRLPMMIGLRQGNRLLAACLSPDSRVKRRGSWSQLPVSNDSDAFRVRLDRGLPLFAGAVGVLSDSGLHAIRGRLAAEVGTEEAPALAERLVERGNAHRVPGRRLLVGKSKGLVFGRYVLLDRLGVGAMGRVFKARHRLMDRMVALKVVLPGLRDLQELASPGSSAR